MAAMLLRGALFTALWLVLAGPDPLDLIVGVATAAAAAWVSIRLLPPGSWRFRPLALAGLVLRFLYQSVVAGIDVAFRAMHPALPVRPGFVTCSLRLPPCTTRSAFLSFSSLLPGTLPAGIDAEGRLLVHCLDAGQPVASEMVLEEARFARACGQDLGPEPGLESGHG
jgi:multicomponent Na+:H+ antiporter subunit E